MSLSVSNFNIDNASGQTVRLDIQACLKALQGQSAEATDLASSKCVAGMLFLNTSGSKILKVRNSSNSNFTPIGSIDQDNLGLLPRAGGTMTGPLLIDDSNSASTPALSFDTDTDLGLFRKAANVLGFSANGEEQAFIDANSLTISSKSSAAKELRFLEPSSAGSQYVGFKAPDTIASNVVWKLPNADASVAGYALVSDTNGNLSWAAAGGGAVGSGNDEIFWENDQTVTQNYTITNGKNAGSFGPITINSNVTVTVGAGETWSVI
tara:strand:- start:1018 stop:1815 length:798 start_codon:yes stop_codon:yes gene_type:complete